MRSRSQGKGQSHLSPSVRASWELMGITPGSSSDELKKAYRRLALLYHPDRNTSPNAGTEFQKVTEVYELLLDPVRVAELNRQAHHEALHRQVIDGLTITFGSFFGYRFYSPGGKPRGATGAKSAIGLLLGANVGRSDDSTQSRTANEDDGEVWWSIEENNSILDNAAYDAIEVVYAGKLDSEDEQVLQQGVAGKQLAALPWVVLNNHGILRFLDGDVRAAKKCYAELCERVPNNIVFMYRLALCDILDGFENPQRNFLGLIRPDRLKIDRGLHLLRCCIKIGADRSVGRQKCTVIRKLIADVLQKTGRVRAAKKVWAEIYAANSGSVEATEWVKGRSAALELARKRTQKLPSYAQLALPKSTQNRA